LTRRGRQFVRKKLGGFHTFGIQRKIMSKTRLQRYPVFTPYTD